VEDGGALVYTNLDENTVVGEEPEA
jgi:hypothetical protein